MVHGTIQQLLVTKTLGDIATKIQQKGHTLVAELLPEKLAFSLLITLELNITLARAMAGAPPGWTAPATWWSG